jgi:hypothetical protein
MINEFLRALSDPEGGKALLALHTADAPVRQADGIGRAADVDPTAFARTHREISANGRDVLPEFGQPVVLETHADPVNSNAVHWFKVTETRTGSELIGALGVSTELGTPLIGWCTLSERVVRWSYRHGLLQSLADYPWMRAVGAALARTLLDASYIRRHWRPPITFSTLPNARFSCQMSTVCCKHDFEIALPREAQWIVDAMPWEELRPELAGTRLPVRADGKLQLKALNETCRFLGDRGQCLIHQTLGRQPFGACSVFPFSFARTPDGIAVSTSPICESARLGIGIAPHEREDDLRERLVHVEATQPERFRLNPEMEVPWETFRGVEKALLEMLAAEDVPLRRRLYMGSRLLGALSRSEPLDSAQWLSEPPAQISDELRQAIHGMLRKIIGWDRLVLRKLSGRIPDSLAGLEVSESAVAARIFQNTLFSKVYSYSFDLTTSHNFVILLYLLILVMQAEGGGTLSDTEWREIGALGVHGMLKAVLHDGVPQGFRTVLGTGDFGQWALST